MSKTDLEIAVDAIKYCRSELSRYRRIIVGADRCEIHTPSKATYDNWKLNTLTIEDLLLK